MPGKSNIPGIGTSMEISGKWLLVCFGTDGYTVKPSNSCEIFDTNEKKWVQPTFGSLPSVRSIARMISVPSKKQIYVFFGADYSEAKIAVEDIWAMNTSSLPTVAWKRIPMSGKNVPSPRMGHSVTLVNDRTIMLWGGRSSPQSNASDTTNYIFDTVTDTWIDPDTDFMTIRENDDYGEKARFITAGVASISILLLLFLVIVYIIRRRKKSEMVAAAYPEGDGVPPSPTVVKQGPPQLAIPENMSETTCIADTESYLRSPTPVPLVQTNSQATIKKPLTLIIDDAKANAADQKSKLAMYESTLSPSPIDSWSTPWHLKVAN